MLIKLFMYILILAPIFCAKVPWYKDSVFYQVYPRSFKDSNNDGTGDIRGVVEKLDYLKNTGVTVVWLSPIFKSPQVDHGYDISDYYSIDPTYGNMDDLIRLLEKSRELDIKIILDLVPNHTSDQHHWFEKSVKREDGYEDYYIWVDAKVDENGNRIPPNKWLSVFSNSAWGWNEERQMYYLHQFDASQPDLNLRNPEVLDELKRILAFYFDLGVDGFRIDAAPYLIEDRDLRDEPLKSDATDDLTYWENFDHIYTKDIDESFEVLYKLRAFVDDYNMHHGGDERIIVTEAYADINKTLFYYGNADATRLGAHFTFNFEFVGFTINTTAFEVKEVVERWTSNLNKKYYLNWSLGNHDNHRAATRLGNVDGYNMLLLFLPGIAATYYAEEIGQENGEVRCEEGTDPKAINNCDTYHLVSRDYERTPFQWDGTVNAGFNSGGSTWLPVSAKHRVRNLAAQNVPGQRSHYNVYRDMAFLRKQLVDYDQVVIGDSCASQNVLCITRSSKSADVYMMIFNMNRSKQISLSLEDKIYEVVVSSVNSRYTNGDACCGENIIVLPQESLILREKLSKNPDPKICDTRVPETGIK